MDEKTLLPFKKDNFLCMCNRIEQKAHVFPYKEDNIFLISTHNLYFLQSIVEKCKDVKVFWTYLENGCTKVKEVKVEDILRKEASIFFEMM